MNSKSFRNFFLGILVLGLLGGIYAYYQFSRSNESLLKVDADFILSYDQLLKDFSSDPQLAGKKYIDKVIQVTGPVKNIEINTGNSGILVMGDDLTLSSLRFSMDSTQIPLLNAFQIGKEESVKGVCNGYNADDMGLGSDVLFNRAVLITNNNQ